MMRGRGAISVSACALLLFLSVCHPNAPDDDLVLVIAGDSRAEGRGLQAVSVDAPDVHVFRQDRRWHSANDPTDTGTRGGSSWPFLAQRIEHAGRRATIITTAEGSTDLYGSGSDQWAPGHQAYRGMIETVQASHVRAVSVVIALIGPNAIINRVTPTREGYRAALEGFAAAVARELPGHPSIVVDLCGEVGTGHPPDRVTARANVLAAIQDASRNNPRIWLGADLRDQSYADHVHPQTDVELRVVADRTWFALEPHLSLTAPVH